MLHFQAGPKMLSFYADSPLDVFMSKNWAFLMDSCICCNYDSTYLLSFS